MGKLALVTGASRGIGRAILEHLAQEGFCVMGTATSESGALAISQHLSAMGNSGKGIVMDISDSASVEAAMKQVHEVGVPLVLVNNAGITRDNLFLRMKEEEWTSVIQTNLNGVYRVTQACIKGMLKARFGRIVNIGSVVASSGNPGQANYCAAKAGLIGFSKSLAQELGSRNITVNVVSPGFIATEMTDVLPEGQREQLVARVPLGRMGKPEDIASAVSFLVSDKANYITGETLHVNGGMYMV